MEYHLPAHVTAQLAGLRLSENQDCGWRDDVRILRWTTKLIMQLDWLDHAENLDGTLWDRFWRREIPARLFDRAGRIGGKGEKTFLLGVPADTIMEYVRIRLGDNQAWSDLALRACRVKHDKKILRKWGRKVTDSRSIAIAKARTRKLIDPKTQELAERRGNGEFKRQLYRALKEGERSGRIPAVAEWNRLRARQILLVECWCAWPAPCQDWPPLCLFAEKARADLCALLLDCDNDDKFRVAIRQELSQLGLERRTKGRKIRDVKLRDGMIRFYYS